jgi:hypothetical protein
MTSAELVKKLNASEWEGPGYGPFIPVPSEGKIVSFYRLNEFMRDDDDGQIPYTLADLGVDKGWLDEHPEGADRGGYVPFVFAGEAKAFFRSGEWQS